MENFIYYDYLKLVNSTIDNSVNQEVLDSTFESFSIELVDYCVSELCVLNCFRFLCQLKIDLHSRKDPGDNISLFNYLSNKMSGLLDTEIEIARYKIADPKLKDFSGSYRIPLLLSWTDSKAALVELIYAIAVSLNYGKASIKAIASCFEFIFQVKIGNYYDILGEINIRKKDETRYLDSLVKNFKEVLRELNSR